MIDIKKINLSNYSVEELKELHKKVKWELRLKRYLQFFCAHEKKQKMFKHIQEGCIELRCENCCKIIFEDL